MIQLLEFPHSHFCEKVRWALDFKGIPFARRSLFPGWHLRTVRKIAPKTTVPVLIHGSTAVQGSSTILSYLDAQFPQTPITIAGQEAEHLAFEAEVDREVGESIRRLLYHRMLADSKQVSFYFMHRSPLYQKLLFRAAYPLVSKKIRAYYRIDDESFVTSKAQLETFVDRLDGVLSRQPYIFGDRFSRADIAAAALLSFLCMPPEHPVPWLPVRDSEIAGIMHQYAERPTIKWVKRVYAERRGMGQGLQ